MFQLFVNHLLGNADFFCDFGLRIAFDTQRNNFPIPLGQLDQLLVYDRIVNVVDPSVTRQNGKFLPVRHAGHVL